MYEYENKDNPYPHNNVTILISCLTWRMIRRGRLLELLRTSVLENVRQFTGEFAGGNAPVGCVAALNKTENKYDKCYVEV